MPGDPDIRREPGRSSDEPARREDGSLAVRAAEGDEGAFEQLVRAHAPAMLRLAARLLESRTEAENGVQESFVSAWRRLPQFPQDTDFRARLFRIVTGRCLDVAHTRQPCAASDAVPDSSAPALWASPDRRPTGAAGTSLAASGVRVTHGGTPGGPTVETDIVVRREHRAVDVTRAVRSRVREGVRTSVHRPVPAHPSVTVTVTGLA